ncbi:hypothetical protein ACWEKM_07180 [Streptomyces sp. NPDC004752]
MAKTLGRKARVEFPLPRGRYYTTAAAKVEPASASSPLAGAVMVLDMCGNGWGNWHWLRDDPSQLMRLLPLTIFGVPVVASVLPLHRAVAGVAGKPETALPSA